jgi:hypothetical protein
MNRPTLFAAVAALLALCASPARAGSVSYFFFPTPGQDIPHNFYANVEFPSPPASATHGWNGTFGITDGVLPYFPHITTVISPNILPPDRRCD